MINILFIKKLLFDKRGFTLIEMIISMSIFILIAAMFCEGIIYSSKFLKDESDQWSIQNNIRLASTFISNEIRTATNLDLISSPLSPDIGYNYIYLDADENKLVYINSSGVSMDKTPSVVNSLLFTLRRDANGFNYLGFSVNGSNGKQDSQITSEVLLNNLYNLNPSMDNVIRYNKSSFIAIEGDGTVSFTFPANTGATSVKLQKSIISGTTGFTDTGKQLDANSNSATVTGLNNGTQYWFKLVVTGGARAGSYLVIATPAAPTVPINNLNVSAGTGQVVFTFSAPTGAASVKLYESTMSQSAGFTDSGVSLNASSTSVDLNGLTNGKQYWFKLVVYGGAAAGDSNVVTATPQ